MPHYTEMTHKEYHAEHIVSEKVCGLCAYTKMEYFMGAVPRPRNQDTPTRQEWEQGPKGVQWCTLPASPKFGTLVAAFGTCDHFENQEPEPEAVTEQGEAE